MPLGTFCAAFRKRPTSILADVAAWATRSRLHSSVTEAPTRIRNPSGRSSSLWFAVCHWGHHETRRPHL